MNSSENLLKSNRLVSIPFPKYFIIEGEQIFSFTKVSIFFLLTEKIRSEHFAALFLRRKKIFLPKKETSAGKSNPCKVSIMTGTPANLAAILPYTSGLGGCVWMISN